MLDRGIRQHNDPVKNGKPCCPARLLSYMQGLGAGAFFVINKLDGVGQRLANVAALPGALDVDADSRPEVERLHAFIATTGLTPTAVVASGGVHDGVEKLQAYWRMSGCPVAAFTRAQLSLVSRIGTDPAVQDASRVMRAAGVSGTRRGSLGKRTSWRLTRPPSTSSRRSWLACSHSCRLLIHGPAARALGDQWCATPGAVSACHPPARRRDFASFWTCMVATSRPPYVPCSAKQRLRRTVDRAIGTRLSIRSGTVHPGRMARRRHPRACAACH